MLVRALPIVALLLPLTGCCSVARLFCGPDRTPWVSVDFTSPEATVRTLLEALRRDEPTVVYRCLASDYLRTLQLDDATMQLAWRRITAANPGLHVAGYAAVPPARRVGTDRAEVTVEIEGNTLQVLLARTCQWHVRYERPAQPPQQPGGAPWVPPPGEVSQSVAGHAVPLVLQQGEDEVERSRLGIPAIAFDHGGVDTLTTDQIEFFGIERLWKVTDVRVLP